MQFATLASLILAGALTIAADEYCTFYSDSACTQQVGGTSYSVDNSGCFQNDGGYISCSQELGTGQEPSFTLVQSPANDQSCNCQSNCAQFVTGTSTDPYHRCVPINLTPGYTDFRLIVDGTCGANNC